MTRARREETAESRRRRLATLLVFLTSWCVSWLHGMATLDRSDSHAAAYKGDANLWFDWARALGEGVPFQLGLPLQPPGTAYLVASVWDGSTSGMGFVRGLWWLFSALAAAFVARAAARGFGERTGLLVGVLFAGSAARLGLDNSIGSEIPYLLLVFASFAWLVENGAVAVGRREIAAWSLVQGLACLVRVEHALFVVLVWAWSLLLWRRAGASMRTLARRTALAVILVLAVITPWQLQAWNSVTRLNESAPAISAGEERLYRAFEERTAKVSWSSEATVRREALPAFSRRQVAIFLAETARRRGDARVTEEDFALVEQAFGGVPRKLPRLFFVSLYGPLNFALAQFDGASGGFSTARLEAPPPLEGPRHLYPPELVGGGPPQLALAYPPHAALVVDGGAIGRRWIREHPAAWMRLVGSKLAIFWSGATLGFSGRGLPLGESGLRRAVDLAAPQGACGATIWRVAVLLLTAMGLWRLRRSAAAVPWLAFAASKIVVTVLFFGYVRQGALLAPIVLLCAVVACVGAEARQISRRTFAGVVALALVLIIVEVDRFVRPPRLLLDGRVVGARDPFPADVHRDQILE